MPKVGAYKSRKKEEKCTQKNGLQYIIAKHFEKRLFPLSLQT
jgi:hypothetical protein